MSEYRMSTRGDLYVIEKMTEDGPVVAWEGHMSEIVSLKRYSALLRAEVADLTAENAKLRRLLEEHAVRGKPGGLIVCGVCNAWGATGRDLQHADDCPLK